MLLYFPQCLQTVSLHKLVAEKCSCHMPSCRIATSSAGDHQRWLQALCIRHRIERYWTWPFSKKTYHFSETWWMSMWFIPYDTKFSSASACSIFFFLLMLQEGEHPHADFYSCVWHRSLSLCQQIAHQEGACGYRWLLYSAKNRLTVSSSCRWQLQAHPEALTSLECTRRRS